MKKTIVKALAIVFVVSILVSSMFVMTGAACDNQYSLNIDNTGGRSLAENSDTTGKLTLDKGTYYFDCNDGDLNYFGTKHSYTIINTGKNSIKIESQLSEAGFNWDTQETRTLAAGKTQQYGYTVNAYPFYQYNTSTGKNEVTYWQPYLFRFKITIEKKTTIEVKFARCRDSKQVSLTNYSYYWQPSSDKFSDFTGESFRSTISILYLNKRDAIKLGKLLQNSGLHKSLNAISINSAWSEYFNDALDIITDVTNQFDPEDRLPLNALKMVASVITTMVVKFVAYKDLKSQLVTLGNELVKAKGVQTVYFEKGNWLYFVERVNSVDKATNDKYYQLYGAWGYDGEFGKITEFK